MNDINFSVDLLFPNDGEAIRDIKFSNISDVKSNHLVEQILRAEASIRCGKTQPIDDIDSYLR